MQQPRMPDYEEICRRWHQATVANHPIKWDAIMRWLAAEAVMAKIDGLPELSESMTVLSNLAHRHAMDLWPQEEQVAA